MAIKIPSKNIYSISNPKVRNNLINKVFIGRTKILPKNEYETNVAQFNSRDFTTTGLDIKGLIKYEHSTTIGVVGQSNYALSASIVELQTYYSSPISFSFSSVGENSYIQKVYDRVKNDTTKEPYIQIDVRQKVVEEKIEDKYLVNLSKILNQDEQDLFKYAQSIEQKVVSDTKTSGSNGVPEEYLSEDKKKVIVSLTTENASVGNANAIITNTLEENNKENISDIKIEYDEETDTYSLSGLIALSGIIAKKLSYEYISGGATGTPPDDIIQLEGTKITIEPIEIEVSILGDTVGIEIEEDSEKYYGEGNKPHTLNGNELLQDSGMFDDVDISQKLADNVLQKYKNGKETATLLCDISDYYDFENNEKIIDIRTERRVFLMHDQVIPMVYGANGKDYPMSKNKDGSPKVFEIIGTKIFYDGAVWQELTLQEIT